MKIKLVFSTLTFVFLFSVNVFTQEFFTAKVVGITDGDTISVVTKDNRQFVVRFAGIDAPEIDQEFGATVKEHLEGLLYEQNVTVTDLKEDCLNRLSASIAFKDKNLNSVLIQVGNAWADSACQINNDFSKIEASAKEKKLGLWQFSNPVRPDIFLKAKFEADSKKAVQENNRRVFAGLGPTKEIAGGIIFIGMTQARFIEACGTKGFPTDTLTSQYAQTFRVDFPATPENIKNGCDGSYIFQRDSPRKPFRLVDAIR